MMRGSWRSTHGGAAFSSFWCINPSSVQARTGHKGAPGVSPVDWAAGQKWAAPVESLKSAQTAAARCRKWFLLAVLQVAYSRERDSSELSLLPTYLHVST